MNIIHQSTWFLANCLQFSPLIQQSALRAMAFIAHLWLGKWFSPPLCVRCHEKRIKWGNNWVGRDISFGAANCASTWNVMTEHERRVKNLKPAICVCSMIKKLPSTKSEKLNCEAEASLQNVSKSVEQKLWCRIKFRFDCADENKFSRFSSGFSFSVWKCFSLF